MMFKKIDPNVVSILGCGWYGLQLAKELVQSGYLVKGSTTTDHKIPLMEAQGIKPYLLDLDTSMAVNESDFFNTDLLIICIPPKKKSTIPGSYIEKIAKIAKISESTAIKNIIFISATSVYGDTNQVADEHSPCHPTSASGIELLKAEHILKENPAFTTTILRFSGLVGPGRHPGRFFAGKKNIPNGKAPVNLIHLTDCTQITLKLISESQFGQTYNVTGPDHPEKQLFYTAAARKLDLEVPEFKSELNEWKIISSINVTDFLHYTYKIKDWMKWLDDNIN